MQKKKIAAAIGLMMTTAGVHAAPFPVVDARTASMGGISVVTANLDAAPFTNPALLAAQRQDADFGLMIAGGAGIADPDNLTGAIEDFQEANNAFDGASDQASHYTNILTPAAANLANKSYGFAVPAGFALSFAWNKWAAAVSGQLNVDAGMGIGTASLPTLNEMAISGIDPTIILEGNAAQSTEVGLSLARNITVGGMKVAFGVTPKTVSVSASTPISQNIGDPDAPDTTPSFDFGSADTNVDLDVGAVVSINDNLKAGVVGRNMLGNTYNSNGTTIEIEPQLRAGVAYTGKLFTVGMDLDLTENQTFGGPSKVMAIGTEINAFDVAQLRAGMTNNTAADQTQYSFGLGFSPLGSNLSVGVITDPDAPDAGTSAFLTFGANF